MLYKHGDVGFDGLRQTLDRRRWNVLPVHGEELMPSVHGGCVVLPQPPMLLGVMVGQHPHHVAIVVYIDHICLVDGADSVFAVPQRVIHIPAYP